MVSVMRKLENLVAVSNVRCVQFRPRVSTDRYFIIIENGDGCWSYVGQNAGLNMNRTVSLQSTGCLYDGTVMHEFLHTLGKRRRTASRLADRSRSQVSTTNNRDRIGTRSSE